MTPAHPYIRKLEITVVALLVFGGAALLLASRAHRLGPSIAFWSLAGIALIAFEWRFAAHRRKVERVRASLRGIARRDLESAGEVVEGGGADFVGLLASNPSFAWLMAQRSTRLSVQGKWRGRDVEIGTAIVAARDADLTVSWVRVPAAGERGPFRVMNAGALASLARMGSKNPVATGDAAFDGKWVVDADEALARAVLAPDLREKLVALHARLPRLGLASVMTTPFGLVVRWPGELTENGAVELRDLAFAAHDRLAAA